MYDLPDLFGSCELSRPWFGCAIIFQTNRIFISRRTNIMARAVPSYCPNRCVCWLLSLCTQCLLLIQKETLLIFHVSQTAHILQLFDSRWESWDNVHSRASPPEPEPLRTPHMKKRFSERFAIALLSLGSGDTKR